MAFSKLTNAVMDAVPTNAIVNFENQDYIFIVTDAHSEYEHHEEADEHQHDEHGHEHKEGEKEHTADEHQPTEGSVTFEKIPVRKGTTDVGYSEITLLKEIPHDSKIVISGAFFILAKMTNQGEGHAH